MAQHTTIYKLDNEGTLGRVKAGEAIAMNDLLYNDELTSKAFKVQTTDFVAVGNVDYGTAQTTTATGKIFDQITTGQKFADAHSRNPIVITDNKEIIALSPDSGANGMHLDRYRPNGLLMNAIQIDATASAASNPQIIKLSNSNIALAYVIGGSIKYMVYDSTLSEVKAITTLVAVASVGFYMIALSGGGFAIVYHDNADNTKNKLVILNNSGTITTAAVDIWTRTGTSGNQFHRMVQLSSGNIAISISSVNTVSSIGLYYAIFSTVGVQVKAITNLDTVSAAWPGEIEQMTGFFAISRANATDQKGYIINNAGTLQGAEFSAATTAGNAANKTKLVTNGTNFYLIWHRSSDSKVVMTLLPITGTNYLTSIITPTSNNPFNLYLDGFCENNVIPFITANSGGTKTMLLVVNLDTRQLYNPIKTDIGDVAGTTNSGVFLRLIPAGDRSFVSYCDFTTPSSLNLYAGKYGRTAISGIAKASAAIDASVPIKTLAPFNEINTIKGNPSKAFDHTGNALAGNKGSLTLSAVTLKGF